MKELYESFNDLRIDLDAYDHNQLSELENKRIKKELLHRIDAEKKEKRRWKFSYAKACACIVCVLCFGSITVAAATGALTEGLKTLFRVDSPKKEQVANEMSSSATLSAVNNGIQITAESVMRDSKHIGIVYTIKRTDGRALDSKKRKCLDAAFHDFDCKDTLGTECNSGEMGTMKQTLDAKSIQCYTIFNFDVTGKKKIHITLSDLQLCFNKNEGNVETKGSWKFVLSTDYKDCSVSLANGQTLKIANQKANLEELSISPMGYYFKIHSKAAFNSNKIISEIEKKNIHLYLKNGKKIPLDGASAPTINDDGTWSFRINGTFDRLILLEEMDKIVVANNTFKVK